MSSGESTNVLANAVGRIDFWVKQPQFNFPNTYPLNGDLSAGLAIQHLNNWSQCCLAMFHVPL